MYRVVKFIDFCYGHRLLNYEGKCKHLHGHNGRVEIELVGDVLDERGMLTDFGDIKTIMKNWIDETLDHRMILNENDPLIPMLREFQQPVYLISHNPTAENIARLIYEQARHFGFPVEKVQLWETPNSFAVYSE